MYFTIIIPTYNSANTIKAAIDSVLMQSFTSFEIVLLDACSTDTTIQIAKSFNDTRIIIHSEKDNGVYDAMNKGIALAQGEWVYFLGSDDELNNDKVLFNIYQHLKQNNSINILYGNVFFNSGRPAWASNSNVYDGEFTFEKLLNQNICHQSIFYRRDFIVLNKFKYSLKYPICADWDFNIRCWLKSPFHFIDLIIANFRAGGLSSSSTIDTFPSNRFIKLALYQGQFGKFTLLLSKKYLRYLYNKLKFGFTSKSQR